MVGESISSEAFVAVLIELKDRMDNGQISSCDNLIEEVLSVTEGNVNKIDKNYINDLAEKKRKTRIDNIERMLREMSLKQIDNVHRYVSDEYDEPDHESQALDAILKLSRKGYA